MSASSRTRGSGCRPAVGCSAAALATAPGRSEEAGSLERAGLVATGTRDLRTAVSPAPVGHHRAAWLPLSLALGGLDPAGDRVGERARASGAGRGARADLGAGHRRGVAPCRSVGRARSMVRGARRPFGPLGGRRRGRPRDRLALGPRRAAGRRSGRSPPGLGLGASRRGPGLRVVPAPSWDRRGARGRRGRTRRTRGVRAGPVGAVVPGARRPFDRVLVPAARGRAADGARARRRLSARSGPRTRLPRDRALAPARRLGGERRDGARPDRGARGRPAMVPVAAVRARDRDGGVLRRADRRRAVGDARRRDGGARADRRPARPPEEHGVDPRGRRRRPARDRSGARVVGRVPAVGRGHGEHGRARHAVRRSGCGSSRRRCRWPPVRRSPRRSA